MPVSRHQLMNELQVKIEDDPEVKLQTLKFAEEVKEYWKRIAPDSGSAGHPWSTGEYKDSIERIATRGKGKGGRFIWHHWVGTFDPIANLLEYGTGPDDVEAGKTGGNWIGLDGLHYYGSNTPTPAFAFAARTAIHFGGTPD